MPPRDDITCEHAGVVGRGFEAHGIEGTRKFTEPVSGTELHPIDSIIEVT